MREIRLSGSVEGVMGNHDLYSDSNLAARLRRDGTVFAEKQIPLNPRPLTSRALVAHKSK